MKTLGSTETEASCCTCPQKSLLVLVITSLVLTILGYFAFHNIPMTGISATIGLVALLAFVTVDCKEYSAETETEEEITSCPAHKVTDTISWVTHKNFTNNNSAKSIFWFGSEPDFDLPNSVCYRPDQFQSAGQCFSRLKPDDLPLLIVHEDKARAETLVMYILKHYCDMSQAQAHQLLKREE